MIVKGWSWIIGTSLPHKQCLNAHTITKTALHNQNDETKIIKITQKYKKELTNIYTHAFIVKINEIRNAMSSNLACKTTSEDVYVYVNLHTNIDR